MELIFNDNINIDGMSDQQIAEAVRSIAHRAKAGKIKSLQEGIKHHEDRIQFYINNKVFVQGILDKIKNISFTAEELSYSSSSNDECGSEHSLGGFIEDLERIIENDWDINYHTKKLEELRSALKNLL